MLQRTFLTDFQSQVVQSGILIGDIHPADSLLQSRCAVQKYRAEIKVVTQSAYLIIDNRGIRSDATRLVEVVGINHCCTCILHQCLHAFQGEQHKRQSCELSVNQCVRGVTVCCHEAHILRRADISLNLMNFSYQRLLAQVLQRGLNLLLRLIRNETCDVFHCV